ncbi:MAG: ATP-binding protein [Thiohalomonadaceae bacterium]
MTTTQLSKQSVTLQGVLDALPGAVVVLDARGRVVNYNPEAVKIFGEPLADTVWREVIARCFVQQLTPGAELHLHDGRILSLATCPLGNSPGQILLFQNITESHKLQAELQQQQRLIDMGRMAASLAHQIRTPLSAALLYASQLKQIPLSDEQRQRFAERTVTSLQQLELLIANMLHFARGGISGEELLQAKDMLQSLRERVAEQTSGHAIKWSFQADGLQLRANRSLLLSAWQNLLNNALAAVGEHGQIEVFCRAASAGAIDFGVHDNGPGVAAEMQACLFEPFKSSRTRGTGLGLAIVRSVARAHHGDVWHRSVPGDTTFAMRLPTVPAELVVVDDKQRFACA